VDVHRKLVFIWRHVFYDSYFYIDGCYRIDTDFHMVAKGVLQPGGRRAVVQSWVTVDYPVFDVCSVVPVGYGHAVNRIFYRLLDGDFATYNANGYVSGKDNSGEPFTLKYVAVYVDGEMKVGNVWFNGKKD
jgi:hypothetical protein